MKFSLSVVSTTRSDFSTSKCSTKQANVENIHCRKYSMLKIFIVDFVHVGNACYPLIYIDFNSFDYNACRSDFCLFFNICLTIMEGMNSAYTKIHFGTMCNASEKLCSTCHVNNTFTLPLTKFLCYLLFFKS